MNHYDELTNLLNGDDYTKKVAEFDQFLDEMDLKIKKYFEGDEEKLEKYKHIRWETFQWEKRRDSMSFYILKKTVVPVVFQNEILNKWKELFADEK